MKTLKNKKLIQIRTMLIDIFPKNCFVYKFKNNRIGFDAEVFIYEHYTRRDNRKWANSYKNIMHYASRKSNKILFRKFPEMVYKKNYIEWLKEEILIIEKSINEKQKELNIIQKLINK